MLLGRPPRSDPPPPRPIGELPDGDRDAFGQLRQPPFGLSEGFPELRGGCRRAALQRARGGIDRDEVCRMTTLLAETVPGGAGTNRPTSGAPEPGYGGPLRGSTRLYFRGGLIASSARSSGGCRGTELRKVVSARPTWPRCKRMRAVAVRIQPSSFRPVPFSVFGTTARLSPRFTTERNEPGGRRNHR